MGVKIALATVAVALTVAACDSGDPSPTAVPTQAVPSTTVTPSPPPTTTPAATPSPTPPALPTTATQDTPAGAESFARYWLATLDYATSSGDTKPLRALGTCASCTALANSIDSLYTSGGRAEGGAISVTKSSVARFVAGKAALVRVDYDQAAGREISSTGTAKSIAPSKGLAFAFTLDRVNSRWTLIKLQTVRAG